MRGLMLALRITGGCWFWLFLAVGLASLFVNVNVATGAIDWGTRIRNTALLVLLAMPGLAAWILIGRWLAQQPPRQRGFEVQVSERKH